MAISADLGEKLEAVVSLVAGVGMWLTVLCGA